MTEVMSNGKTVELREMKIKEGLMVQAWLNNPEIKIGKLLDKILPIVSNLSLSEIWDLTVGDMKLLIDKFQELNGLKTDTVKKLLEEQNVGK